MGVFDQGDLLGRLLAISPVGDKQRFARIDKTHPCRTGESGQVAKILGLGDEHRIAAGITDRAAGPAAADLTVGTLHDDATALIRQKYGDISSIQIQSISLNPTTGLTISVLRLVNKDGTTQTQRTTLHFTLTGDPKITNPGG